MAAGVRPLKRQNADKSLGLDVTDEAELECRRLRIDGGVKSGRMDAQVDPGGQVLVHAAPPQLHHRLHLPEQGLVLAQPGGVFLLSNKEQEQRLAQGQEGRQVFHRQLGLSGHDVGGENRTVRWR